MPTNSPSRFTKAPPELPGFTTASVCMKDSIGKSDFLRSMLMFLPFALTMPAVTVEFRLKGFPTASTHCPTFTSSESSMVRKGRLPSFILIRAKSVEGSVPMMVAS